MRQELFRRGAVRLLPREEMRLPQNREELQPGKFIGDFDVGAVTTNTLRAVIPLQRPFRPAHEINIPFRRGSEFRSAITKKGIASRTNFICEGNNQRAILPAETSQVRFVIRDNMKLQSVRALQPDRQNFFVPGSLCAPQSFTREQKGRFPLENSNEFHLRARDKRWFGFAATNAGHYLGCRSGAHAVTTRGAT